MDSYRFHARWSFWKGVFSMNPLLLLSKLRSAWPMIRQVLLVGWTLYQAIQRRKNQKAAEKAVAEAALKNSAAEINEKISKNL